jgi:hypothetical protein
MLLHIHIHQQHGLTPLSDVSIFKSAGNPTFSFPAPKFVLRLSHIRRTQTSVPHPNTDRTHSHMGLRHVLRPHNHPPFVSPILARFVYSKEPKSTHTRCLAVDSPHTYTERLSTDSHTLPRRSNSGDKSRLKAPPPHAADHRVRGAPPHLHRPPRGWRTAPACDPPPLCWLQLLKTLVAVPSCAAVVRL